MQLKLAENDCQQRKQLKKQKKFQKQTNNKERKKEKQNKDETNEQKHGLFCDFDLSFCDLEVNRDSFCPQDMSSCTKRTCLTVKFVISTSHRCNVRALKVPAHCLTALLALSAILSISFQHVMKINSSYFPTRFYSVS